MSPRFAMGKPDWSNELRTGLPAHAQHRSEAAVSAAGRQWGTAIGHVMGHGRGAAQTPRPGRENSACQIRNPARTAPGVRTQTRRKAPNNESHCFPPAAASSDEPPPPPQSRPHPATSDPRRLPSHFGKRTTGIRGPGKGGSPPVAGRASRPLASLPAALRGTPRLPLSPLPSHRRATPASPREPFLRSLRPVAKQNRKKMHQKIKN